MECRQCGTHMRELFEEQRKTYSYLVEAPSSSSTAHICPRCHWFWVDTWVAGQGSCATCPFKDEGVAGDGICHLAPVHEKLGHRMFPCRGGDHEHDALLEGEDRLDSWWGYMPPSRRCPRRHAPFNETHPLDPFIPSVPVPPGHGQDYEQSYWEQQVKRRGPISPEETGSHGIA